MGRYVHRDGLLDARRRFDAFFRNRAQWRRLPGNEYDHFRGRANGDTITATIKFESRGTTTIQSGAMFDSVESGVFTVTLRKTGEKNEGGVP